MLKFLVALIKFCLNYGNPLTILYKRTFAKNGSMLVIDRNSSISCYCTVGSYRMFGEVWHDKDYDVPYLPLRKDDVVLDIGANQGFFACYAAYHEARVYAFEPFPASYENLTRNLRYNCLHTRVTTQAWAISNYNGQAELICSNRLGGGMNTIKQSFAHAANIGVTQKINVPCITLSAILDQFSIAKVRLCKLDCEGAEYDILQNLQPEHLQKIEAFVVEFHPEAYPVNDFIKLLLSWKTHQVSFADDKYCPRAILRVIANSSLQVR